MAVRLAAGTPASIVGVGCVVVIVRPVGGGVSCYRAHGLGVGVLRIAGDALLLQAARVVNADAHPRFPLAALCAYLAATICPHPGDRRSQAPRS